MLEVEISAHICHLSIPEVQLITLLLVVLFGQDKFLLDLLDFTSFVAELFLKMGDFINKSLSVCVVGRSQGVTLGFFLLSFEGLLLEILKFGVDLFLLPLGFLVLHGPNLLKFELGLLVVFQR